MPLAISASHCDLYMIIIKQCLFSYLKKARTGLDRKFNLLSHDTGSGEVSSNRYLSSPSGEMNQ
jgi:hypothetical protein